VDSVDQLPITNAQQTKEIWFNYRRRWRVEVTFRYEVHGSYLPLNA
jgi:hypothetical protein